MALTFTDANFETEVLSTDKLTVVDFWAEWCGPCRAMSPVIEELAKEYEGKVAVGKLNVDHNPGTAIDYSITSIPVIMFFKDGKSVYKFVGSLPKAGLVKKIQELLNPADKPEE